MTSLRLGRGGARALGGAHEARAAGASHGRDGQHRAARRSRRSAATRAAAPSTGSASPLTSTAAGIADCLMPNASPWRSSGTWSAMNRLIAGWQTAFASAGHAPAARAATASELRQPARTRAGSTAVDDARSRASPAAPRRARASRPPGPAPTAPAAKNTVTPAATAPTLTSRSAADLERQRRRPGTRAAPSPRPRDASGQRAQPGTRRGSSQRHAPPRPGALRRRARDRVGRVHAGLDAGEVDVARACRSAGGSSGSRRRARSGSTAPAARAAGEHRVGPRAQPPAPQPARARPRRPRPARGSAPARAPPSASSTTGSPEPTVSRPEHERRGPGRARPRASARRPSRPSPTPRSPGTARSPRAPPAARSASRPTSASTPATPEALSLAPGTVGLRAWSSHERRAPGRARAAGSAPQPERRRRQRQPRAASASEARLPLRWRRRGRPAARQARVPHQAGVRGVVVGDQHERALARRRAAGRRPDDVRARRRAAAGARSHCTRPEYSSSNEASVAAAQQAPAARAPRARPTAKWIALRVREGALVAERLDPHVLRALLAQAAARSTRPSAARPGAAEPRSIAASASMSAAQAAVPVHRPGGQHVAARAGGPSTRCASRAHATSRSRSMPVS